MSDEFADRELCPDGACIGVIGPDGRCKECGTPGTRPASSAPAPGPDSEDDEELVDSGDQVTDEPDDAAADEPNENSDDQAATDSGDGGGEWDDRALCSDGACIGVIGPDGRCRECGKPG